MSIGDLLVQGMRPPNPNPQPQGSPQAGPMPQGAPGQPQGQTLPPAQSYAPDPSVGASIQQLMQMHEQDRRANSVDRGLAMMAGSFGPVSTRAAIMNSAQPENDRIAAMGGAVRDAAGMQALQEHQMLLSQLGLAPGGGAPAGGGMMSTLSAQTGIPANVLTTIYLTNPSTFGEEVNKASQMKAGVPAQQAAQMAQAKDVEEFKNSGIQDFSAAHQKLTETEAGVDQLLNDIPSTMKALAAPDFLTTSKLGAWLPGYGEDTKKQAIAIQKLEAGLTGESLQSVKNVRNQREFATLGEALTAGLNANNGTEGVQKALEAIKQKMATAHAQVYATAGKEIPTQYSGLADPAYTSPTIDGKPNPYYTGATYEKPSPAHGTNPTQPGGGFDYSALKSGETYTAPDGSTRTKR